jgi:hypothetical protein
MDVYLTDLRGLSWLRDRCLARACACVYVLGRSGGILGPLGVVGRFGDLRLRWRRSVPGSDHGLAGLRCEDRIAQLGWHGETVLRPLLPVSLVNGDRETPRLAGLVANGADLTLVSDVLAEQLGIDLEDYEASG